MVRLKNGIEVPDPRLDRLVEFDEASRNFPIRTVVQPERPKHPPRSYTWRIQAPWVIDQGREGACVGYAVTNELKARPAEVQFSSEERANHFAKANIYWSAQKIDPWPGGSYPGASPRYEGTSVLAGMKIAKQLGYFEEYRWSFGLEDLVYGLGYAGPAVLGVRWDEPMYEPDPHNHFIWPDAQKSVGGHAILARAIRIRWTRMGLDVPPRERGLADVDLDASAVMLRNSWGRSYGSNGDCYITLRELERLLDDRGEACFALKRTTVGSATR